ncbi:MAG TPA: hypothetical protein VMZ91_08675 [Candidatus Paceibacterota bacterium]|nr:hypothetical protein [Candidatus Paceibacterota bacterium]
MLDEKNKKVVMNVIIKLMLRKDAISKKFGMWASVICVIVAFSFAITITNTFGISNFFSNLILGIVFFDLFYFEIAYNLTKIKIPKKNIKFNDYEN